MRAFIQMLQMLGLAALLGLGGACSDEKTEAPATEPPAEDVAEAADPGWTPDPGTEPAPEPKRIVPGQGFEGSAATLKLGWTLAEVQAGAKGEPLLRPLGPLGQRFAYPDLGAQGLLQGEGEAATVRALYLGAGFVGQTDEGIGLGSTTEQVEAAYGKPDVEPFVRTRWYRERGIGFTVEDAAVVRIVVVRAAL